MLRGPEEGSIRQTEDSGHDGVWCGDIWAKYPTFIAYITLVERYARIALASEER